MDGTANGTMADEPKSKLIDGNASAYTDGKGNGNGHHDYHEEYDHTEPSHNQSRAETIDLGSDGSLTIDIPDALSERDKAKFTVRTKTTLPAFKNHEMQVTRLHEEFVWLHDRYVDCDEYAGIIIPPAPPRPDFDASREKLQRLGEEGDGALSKEEFAKLKQELEAEYLATFKKTVAMHEVFLQRLGAHPILRSDANFRVFLEYDGDLSVRTKNKKEKLFSMFEDFITKPVTKVYMTQTQKDPDEYFDQQKSFLNEYYSRSKEACAKSDTQVALHRDMNDQLLSMSGALNRIAHAEQGESRLKLFFTKLAEAVEKIRKVECRLAADEDLKLSDTMRYYFRDSEAARDLLIRRLIILQNYEGSVKTVEQLAAKGKNTKASEEARDKWKDRFEKMTDQSRAELKSFRQRRVGHFRRNLTDFVELEIKHAKNIQQLLRSAIQSIKDETGGQ